MNLPNIQMLVDQSTGMAELCRKPSIEKLPLFFDIRPLCEQIARHPDIWNTHTMRTDAYATPHKSVSDIWVRYNAWRNFTGDIEAFNGEHDSEWYPVIHKIPAAWSIAKRLCRALKGKRLGGVLITKVPAGGEVRPHVDHGWHAGYYEKFAVQLASTSEQAFCFEDGSLSALPGEVYTFQNDRLHWVTNPSNEDRMTMIVCVKR